MSTYEYLKNFPNLSYEERLGIIRSSVTGHHSTIQGFALRIQHYLPIDFPTEANECQAWLELIFDAADHIQEISQILTDFDPTESVKKLVSKYKYLENYPNISYEQRLWLIRNSVRGRYATLHGSAELLKRYILSESTEEVHKYEVWIDKIIAAANDIRELSQILTDFNPPENPTSELTDNG